MTVMRLLILFSLVNNGLKPKVFDEVRHALLQIYGFDKILLLHNLQKLGETRRRWLSCRTADPEGGGREFRDDPRAHATGAGRRDGDGHERHELRHERLRAADGAAGAGDSAAGRGERGDPEAAAGEREGVSAGNGELAARERDAEESGAGGAGGRHVVHGDGGDSAAEADRRDARCVMKVGAVRVRDRDDDDGHHQRSARAAKPEQGAAADPRRSQPLKRFACL